MQVKINVSPLPSVVTNELKCVFGDFESKAEMNNRQVVCALPNPVDIPPTPEMQGENSLTSPVAHPPPLRYLRKVLICSGLAFMCKLIL